MVSSFVTAGEKVKNCWLTRIIDEVAANLNAFLNSTGSNSSSIRLSTWVSRTIVIPSLDVAFSISLVFISSSLGDTIAGISSSSVISSALVLIARVISKLKSSGHYFHRTLGFSKPHS